jgi:hypothetical protein
MFETMEPSTTLYTESGTIIVSAISYAMQKKALGERAYVPARIGRAERSNGDAAEKNLLAAESAAHVRTQVSDLDYDTRQSLRIGHVYHACKPSSGQPVIPTLPVTDEEAISTHAYAGGNRPIR